MNNDEPIFDNEEQKLEYILKKSAERLAAIKAEKAAIAAKEAEEKRLAEIEEAKKKPFTVTIFEVSPQRKVVIQSAYNQEFVNQLRLVIGRSYDGTYNSIPVDEWELFVRDVTAAIPNIAFTYSSPAVEAKLAAALNEGLWEVELSQYAIKVKTHTYNTGILYRIPGVNYLPNEGKHEVPRSEAWQLWEALSKEKKVNWSNEALTFVQTQLEKRAKLDKIATLDRGEIYFNFGFKEENDRLRNFQEVGADFVEATDGRALLAYEMGLGKTWIALAYAWKNKKRTLIVCPASLKNNWAREIMKLTGERPRVLRGAEPTRLDIADIIADPRQFTIINYDIISRKNEFTKETFDEEGYKHIEDQVRFPWVEILNLGKFDLMIADEAHYAKNVDSNRSQAVRLVRTPHVIPMTGTPVLNRPGELWPLLNMIDPIMFPAFDTFKRQYTIDGKEPKNIDELRTTLKSMMIRRLKKDVMKDLPKINRIQEYHELSAKGKKLYDKVLQGIYETIDKAGNDIQKSVTNILVQIQRLKQICAIDKCSHTADLAVQLYDQTEDTHKKVIIFSQYKMTCYKIAQMLELDSECLSFVRRKGNEFYTADASERDAIVQRFQTDPDIKYLCVTEKTTKEGHNITAAGHVLFNDLFWTPAAHEQAEGRAYGRQNDPHGINSYYMITDMEGDSIDEWIMALLANKMRMIEEVVEGVEGSRDVSIVNELIEKFKSHMRR